MTTRLTVDLENPKLLKLLNLEAQAKGVPKKKIVISALETYFSEKSENLALLKLAEKSFSEWNNPRDDAYDKL
jgi:hypothetical protein